MYKCVTTYEWLQIQRPSAITQLSCRAHVNAQRASRAGSSTCLFGYLLSADTASVRYFHAAGRS